jgi:integrase
MHNHNYSSKAINKSILCGFAPILFYSTAHDTAKYNAIEIAKFIGDVRTICQSGKCGVSMIHSLLNAGKLLQNYHDLRILILPKEERWHKDKRILTQGFEKLLDTYRIKNEELQMYSQKTIGDKVHYVKTFLWYMERCGVTSVNDFSHKSINTCFTKLSPNYVDGAKSIANEVKRFMTFLYNSGLTPTNYAEAIPQGFPHRRKIRFGFTQIEIHDLLNCVDRATKRGKRDYAIMLIAARTGLRAGDIAKLKLSEIDWHTKEIRIIQQKTGVPFATTLTHEVGNAIVDYFENARGMVKSQYMFPLSKNTLEHIKSPTISAIATKYMNIAGIDNSLPYRGIHSFRRSFGKRLLDASLTPDMLMELLGQTSSNSIIPYTAIYEDGLRRCSLPLSSITEAAL